MVASAMAHPGRRQIVDRLRAGPATTTELAALVGVGLPAMAKHIGLLTDATLVASTKRGRTVTHELRTQPLDDYATWLTARSSFWHNQLDALETAASR